MKAYVLQGIGDLRYEEAERPLPAPGEVLVEVKAVGICGSDIPRIFENGTYSFPLIPGHEFSGIVAEEGSGVRGLLGKRVGVFPLLPCKNCGPCNNRRYEMCRHYSYLGSRRNGAFAEYVTVPVWNLVELPEGVSFEAAAMLEPMAVAVHAMRSMAPAPGERIAVCGLGTIGLLLTVFLREAGFEDLFVIGNKAFQRENALKLGIPAARYIDGKKEDVVGRIGEGTKGQGVDVFFECVGRTETVLEALRVAAPGGRIQFVGNPASDMPFDRDTYWKILRNQLTIRGSWNSTFLHDQTDDWHYVLDRLAAGKICPERYITRRLSLGELPEGLRIMRDKTEEYIKVMVSFP